MQKGVELMIMIVRKLNMLLKETNAAWKREVWMTTKYTFWRGFGVLSVPNRTSPFAQFSLDTPDVFSGDSNGSSSYAGELERNTAL